MEGREICRCTEGLETEGLPPEERPTEDERDGE